MPNSMIQKLKAQIKEYFQFIINKRLEIILLLIILSLLILWKVSGNIIIFLILGSILLLYGWEARVIVRSLTKAKRDIVNKRLCTILLLIILALLLIWKFSIEAVVLWMILLSFLFYNWENRIIAGAALIFLASCPILLIQKKEAAAEQMAIYAYYFLVMTVVLQIKEYWGESKNLNKLNSKDDL